MNISTLKNALNNINSLSVKDSENIPAAVILGFLTDHDCYEIDEDLGVFKIKEKGKQLLRDIDTIQIIEIRMDELYGDLNNAYQIKEYKKDIDYVKAKWGID